MLNENLLSNRNKVIFVGVFVIFVVLIFLLGRLVLRNQLPSLMELSETGNEIKKPNFKPDLKMVGELYGIEKEKVLLPEITDIAGGNFQMGSASDGPITEQPQHEVTLTPFSISRTEITNAQYLAFCKIAKHDFPQDPHWQGLYMRDNPNHPIVGVTWQDAIDYCQWLGTVLDKEVRLPTEAEWEYAAQGSQPGTTIEYSQRELLPTTRVGSYPPNRLGLFDTLGNVWEWCSDWYNPSYYSESPKENPTGPVKGEFRVIRGGSWAESFNISRPSHRNKAVPSGSSPSIGFRVVVAAKGN